MIAIAVKANSPDNVPSAFLTRSLSRTLICLPAFLAISFALGLSASFAVFCSSPFIKFTAPLSKFRPKTESFLSLTSA
jgi:hypothetical protein